ncbi:MAG: phosphoglycerate dehydrogenase [Spirochaetales bacterium]|nr:phosphoglycerate dehydrogenase [Spirochaetales bacterium]
MYRISTLNKIATEGLEKFDRANYEVASEISCPDAILLRSQKINDMEFPPTLKAIARAGAGVNNIDVPRCSEAGVVVFNTPGANANSVKELVLAGLLLSARKIYESIEWVKTIKNKGDEVPQIIEKNKSNFAGQEIAGKKLGVIGLGAIGVMVANDALALGMEVIGYDPFISVDAAWGLSRDVRRANSLDGCISDADYITIHVPLSDKTKGLIGGEKIAVMKKGVKILNFSRNGLINNVDLINALNSGHVAGYVTDFPDEQLLNTENVICIPHLGASSEEAEINCAVMAADQLKDFLENGNIKNSVNFPDCVMDKSGEFRLVIANKNVPNMVGQITTILADNKINIADMLNRHQGDYAYNIIDVNTEIPKSAIEKIRKTEGILMVRVLPEE